MNIENYAEDQHIHSNVNENNVISEMSCLSNFDHIKILLATLSSPLVQMDDTPSALFDD